VFVVLFVLAYTRFLFHLPRRTAGLFLLAGATFVGGAIGMEMVSGAHIDAGGSDRTYTVLVYIEESLEITGVAVFAYALMAYLGSIADSILITFSDAVPD
jgi:hypothetical protein